ncbi:MAG TPA: hypothetical protein VGV61_01990 [Thermoanaerobaculia bacterium]|jgi:thiol-disulfide isomerase/thioredoxin|nr:hypothetical protein [Thermoanaerobaculia bacterium]
MRRLATASGRRLAVAGLILFGALAGAALASPALAAAEGWRLPGLNGGALSADDVAHGTTVMVVFAGWSPRCKDIVERSNRLVGKWEGRARVILVDFQEDPDEVSRFLAGKGAQAAVYLDGDGGFAKRHQVTTLPGLVVYRDGTLVYHDRLPDDPDRVLAPILQ